MPRVTRSEQWYRARLSRYFDEHFIGYEDSVLWFTDPAPNQWLFDIPELNTRVELTCDTSGNVTVIEYPINRKEK